MDKQTTITLAKGGTKEKTIPINRIVIPDLWHLAVQMEGENKKMTLECWHLCHDLLRHIKEGE